MDENKVNLDNLNLVTLDSAVYQQGEVFLVGELERLDPKLYLPIHNVTWARDMDLRTDATYADDSTSYAKTYVQSGTMNNPLAVGLASGNSNTPPEVGITNEKVVHPFRSWQKGISYSLKELLASERIKRPIDVQKHDAIQLDYQLALDRAIYIGDKTYKFTGLLNNSGAISRGITLEGAWKDVTTTPDEILNDINTLLQQAWEKTKYTVCPDRILIDPARFSLLISRKVSEANPSSIMEYVLANNISNRINGKQLQILPLKWLADDTASLDGSIKNRVVAYTRDYNYLRYPHYAIQRLPEIQRFGLEFQATYYAGFGEMELIYDETLVYGEFKS